MSAFSPPRNPSFPCVLAAAALALVGCSSGSDTDDPLESSGASGIATTGSDPETSTSSPSTTNSLDDDGGGDSGQADVDTGTNATDGVCAAKTVEAELETRPVDIIVIIDTSPSMDPVSSAVEQNINANFATIIGNSGLDYRVILLASHGGGDDMCVAAPLGGTTCNPPPNGMPAITDRFFHYDRQTGSGSMLNNIVAWYTEPDPWNLAPNGWSSWARPEAHKVILAITDALQMGNNTSPGDAFDSNLLAVDPAQFGNANARNYVFHTISGLRENDPPTEPWPPTEPIINNDCSGFSGKEPGQALQQVSVLSGGLRFPLCQYESFDVVFNVMAEGIVQGTPVSCSIEIPEPPPGEELDPDTLEVEYFPMGAEPGTLFHQVADLAACEPDAFYVEANEIVLCAATCTVVQADLSARLETRYGCDVGYVPAG